MAFDWQRLIELAPLAIMRPGSPQGAAMLKGYQGALQRMRQEKVQQHQLGLQDQQAQRQDALAQAQMQNLEADNTRGDQQLQMQQAQQALNRIAAYRHEDTGTLGALDKAPELALAPDATPLSAQNDLTVKRLSAQQDYGIPAGTPQGPLPDMTQAVATRDTRLARQIMDRHGKLVQDPLYAGYSPADLERMTVQFKGQPKSIAEIRALAGEQLNGPDGQALPPMLKPQPVTGTETERGQSLLEKIDAAKAAGDPTAAAKFQRQYQNLIRAKRDLGQADDRPRESSARDVASAREAAYQAVVAGGSSTVAARALRQAGLDPEIELGRVRRQVDADVRRIESQLPNDRYGEDRTDPAVFDARMKRARDILRGGGATPADASAPAPAPSAEGALRQEARRQLEGARRAAGDARPVTDAEINLLLSKPGNTEVLRRHVGAGR